MTATFTHGDGNINTVTITFTYNNCVTQLDSDNKKIPNRVMVIFTNIGYNNGMCLCICSEAVGEFRVRRYNLQFISNFISCSYPTEIVILQKLLLIRHHCNYCHLLVNTKYPLCVLRLLKH